MSVTVKELKKVCYLYSILTDSDKALKSFKQFPNVNFKNDDHLKSLIIWLRKWGCRQFMKDNKNGKWEAGVRKKISLIKMYGKNRDILTLKQSDSDKINKVFNEIASIKSGKKIYKNGKESDVTIGPVGASKILFAYNADLYMPWDNPICDELEYSKDGKDYFKHLTKGQEFLRNIKITNINKLPKLIERKDSSLPKIYDEYLWVTITNREKYAKIKDFCSK